MIKINLIGLFTLIFLFGCNPNKEMTKSKNWYKGNLHTHSYWSDGDEFPEVIMDWYKTNGYHFVALSDHNILAEGEKWITIRSDSMYQKAFDNYLNYYGPNWVDHKMDSTQIQVKLKTLDEYRGRFEKNEEFLIIPSQEITDHYEKKPIHVNATNIENKIEPQGGISVIDVLQNNIDQVLRQREALNKPMIPHINHPNFGWGIELKDIIALKGERFFEVYNGHPSVNNSGDATHISTEEMWDLINISYIETGKPLMYGLATDDSHHYHTIDSKWSNAGRGWIMVQSDSLNAHSLIDAMEKGNFYASTGVLLKEYEVDQSIHIEVEEEEGVTYTISFIGCKKGQSVPLELSIVKGGLASFKLEKDLLFVRSKITSSKLQKNPIEDILYEEAWTQPVLIK